MGTLSTIIKRARWAAGLDAIDGTLGIIALAVLVLDRFYLPYSVAFILAGSIATYLVAIRWPGAVWKAVKGPKRVAKKRPPCTKV